MNGWDLKRVPSVFEILKLYNNHNIIIIIIITTIKKEKEKKKVYSFYSSDRTDDLALFKIKRITGVLFKRINTLKIIETMTLETVLVFSIV